MVQFRTALTIYAKLDAGFPPASSFEVAPDLAQVAPVAPPCAGDFLAPPASVPATSPGNRPDAGESLGSIYVTRIGCRRSYRFCGLQSPTRRRKHQGRHALPPIRLMRGPELRPIWCSLPGSKYEPKWGFPARPNPATIGQHLPKFVPKAWLWTYTSRQ